MWVNWAWRGVRLWRADKTADGPPHHVAAAYATGYGTAYASHQDLARRYIAELNKPRIKLPTIVGFVGAVGVGLVVGRVMP